MLLGVVADLEAVAGLQLTGVGLVDAGEDAQQRRLAGTVEPEHDDLRAAVDREIDVGEDLQRPVRLRQSRRHERRLAAGGGLGEAELGDAVFLTHIVEAGEHLLGTGDHLVRCGRLRRLRAEPGRLHLQHGGLLLDVGALLLAALLVGHPLAQVVLPVHVVDVDHLAVGVEVEHAVDRLADQLHIVGDDDEAALVVLEELPQPHDAVRVEVVRRLVEDHRLGVGEQDARQLDAPALTTREGRQRLVEDAVGKREVVRDGRRLRLCGVPAERFEALGEVRVAPHRLGGHGGVVRAHFDGCLVHADRERTEPTGIEDAGASEHRGVTRARVLRQVAELSGAVDAPFGGRQVAGEHLGQSGLSRSVTADESDLVSVGHAEGDVRHEHTGAHADLEVVHGEHSERPFLEGGGGIWHRASPPV